MINGIKIEGITELGIKGIKDTKKSYKRAVVKSMLNQLKITLIFHDTECLIHNPAFKYCENLSHPKIQQGLKGIKEKYRQMGAKENKDYIIEVF